MHAIVSTYIQLFCIAVFFDSIHCDQMHMNTTQDDYLSHQETACTAECVLKKPEKTLDACYQHCLRQNITRELIKQPLNFSLSLFCRKDTALIVEIVGDFNRKDNDYPHTLHKPGKFDGRLYAVIVQEEEDKYSSKRLYIVDTPFVKIENLTENTSYNISATIVTSEYVVSYVPNIAAFRTLDRNFEPSIVNPESISYVCTPNVNNPKVLDLTILWKPTEDLTCDTQILFHATTDDDKIYNTLHEPIITDLKLYSYVLPNISFDTDYNVALRGVNPKNGQYHLNPIYKSIKTPSCLSIHNDSLTFCAPHPVANIVVNQERVSPDSFNLNITWSAPKWKPDYYIVTLMKSYKEPNPWANVSGDSTHAYLEGITLLEMENWISVEAYSKGGETDSRTSFTLFELYASFWEKYESQLQLLQILVPILLILTVTLVITIILYRRIKRKRSKEQHFMKYRTKEVYLRELASTYNNDEMEIDATSVRLYDVLGEGAFGVVRRGLVLPVGKDVAVKMLKETATVDDVEGFLQEIALMKSVGSHPNIVGIIGHCTVTYNEMMLLTEYCSEGNLLNYLRNAWQQLMLCNRFKNDSAMKGTNKWNGLCVEQTSSADYLKLPNGGPHSNGLTLVENQSYGFDNNNKTMSNLYKSTNGHPVGKLNNLISEPLKSSVDLNHYDVNLVIERNSGETVIPMLVENLGYDLMTTTNPNENDDANLCTQFDKKMMSRGKYLTSADLLNFSKQIATGMHFLSTNKIVHRDLAARNVLVCADKTVKIADFGLSRDIYQDNIYLKSSAGKLPIKWLAIESILQQHYTTQSDVWSFGILLYEIVTLGNIPYPSIPVECLASYLKDGNRMVRPRNCSPQFYELMSSCWHADADKRPHFSYIADKIDTFIKNYSANELIDISFLDDCERVEGITNDSNTSYLKPI